MQLSQFLPPHLLCVVLVLLLHAPGFPPRVSALFVLCLSTHTRQHIWRQSAPRLPVC